tara:strand:- start:482 stop:661 length:180 start_codon:yes stop_codon:yes gene_type:complete
MSRRRRLLEKIVKRKKQEAGIKPTEEATVVVAGPKASKPAKKTTKKAVKKAPAKKTSSK